MKNTQPNVCSRWRLALIASSALATSFSLANSAAAQDTPEADQTVDARVLDTVNVTVTRRDESAVEVPASLTVLNTDQTLSQGVVDINALADFSPGLTATDGGSPGLGNLVIRGLYAGGAPTTGTYIDDVPFGAVVGGFAASTALDASLYDLERVEIVKGPQGTLFGASSVGGVVRYVTRDPDLETFSGYGFVDVSATEDGGDNTLLKGRVSIPVVKDQLAVSLSGYSDNSGGYIDSALTAESDIDESDYSGFRAAAKWVVSDRITLEASYAEHEADFDSASYETFDPTTGEPLFGPLRTEFAAPRALEFDVLALNAEIDLGFATLVSVTSQQNLSLTNSTDLTATLGPTADFLAPAGAPHTVGFSSGDETERTTQEFRLTSPDSDFIEWIVGAYYTNQESVSFQITDVVPNDIELVTLNSGQEYEEYAVFGNLTYYLTPDWDVTGGVRYSDTENTVDQLFSGALSNPLLSGLEDTQSDEVLTWLFNTRYRVNATTNLYGRVASGYRPGGANLTVNFMGTTLGEPLFEPDDLWSYEAGVKGFLLNNALSYDVGVFYVDWQDAQIATTNAAGLGSIANAEDSVTAMGLEASVSGELVENFQVGATLALTDTELQGDEPGLFAMSGESIAGIPDATASLAGDYTYAIGEKTDLIIGATYRYTGGYDAAYSGSPTGTFSTDSYSQVDVRAGLQKGRVNLNLYVTNIGNNDDYQTVFPITPGFAYGVPLRPRTIGANLRVDF